MGLKKGWLEKESREGMSLLLGKALILRNCFSEGDSAGGFSCGSGEEYHTHCGF